MADCTVPTTAPATVATAIVADSRAVPAFCPIDEAESLTDSITLRACSGARFTARRAPAATDFTFRVTSALRAPIDRLDAPAEDFADEDLRPAAPARALPAPERPPAEDLPRDPPDDFAPDERPPDERPDDDPLEDDPLDDDFFDDDPPDDDRAPPPPRPDEPFDPLFAMTCLLVDVRIRFYPILMTDARPADIF